MNLRVALLTLAILICPSLACAEDAYIVSRPDSSADHRKDHSTALLRAALEASKSQYGPYSLTLTSKNMERKRTARELVSGELINVAALLSDADLERNLIPIRIPVDKGLAGFRVALIDGRRQSEFSRIDSLPQLRGLALGVGTQWITRAIYEQDGFKIVTGNDYAGLFGMLMAGRFDYFPRSIEEALLEQPEQIQQYPNIALEKSFALYTPLPRYFFVSPATPHLAERLRVGLEKLLVSGDFDRLFFDYYGPMITKSALCSRRIFRIDNPALTAETPLQKAALWFDPLHATGNASPCRAKTGTTGKATPH
jgi:hypothetical protein